jgi:hypothetical protein
MKPWDEAAAERWFEAYAERSKMTVARLRALGLDVYPCACGSDTCEGWAAVHAALVGAHFDLYAPKPREHADGA